MQDCLQHFADTWSHKKMRVLNPNYTKPANPMSTKKAAIDSWFAANTNVVSITFDQIRTALNQTAAQLPDGAIHEQLNAWGYSVSE
jgi:hypothetical protein